MPGQELTLSFVLMSQNIGELVPFIELAAQLGADQVFCRHLEVYDPGLVSESLFLHQTLCKEVREEAHEAAVSRGLRAYLPRAFEVKRPRTGQRFCTQPWESVVLSGDGRVLTCCNQAALMGNLNEQPLEEIWNGVAYQAFREAVNSENPLPTCENCPTLRYENNPRSCLFIRSPGGDMMTGGR